MPVNLAVNSCPVVIQIKYDLTKKSKICIIVDLVSFLNILHLHMVYRCLLCHHIVMWICRCTVTFKGEQFGTNIGHI